MPTQESTVTAASWSRRDDVVLAAFFVAAAAARLLWLSNMPGVNGDEAWYGVQIVGHQPFAWRTPTGNLLNPFYMVPLWTAHTLTAPAVWVLRTPATLAGFGLLFGGWYLIRNVLGATTAIVFAILAAGTPDLIAYSRFGWDASLTGLAVLVVLYFALRQRWVAALIAQAAAIVVHPTNVLLVPPLFFLFLLQILGPGRHQRRLPLVAVALIAIGGTALLLWITATGPLLRQLDAAAITARARHLDGWWTLAARCADLMSGVTVYQYIVGPVSASTARLHSIVLGGVIAPVALAGLWRAARSHDFRAWAIVGGTSVSIAAMFLVAGLTPFEPHFERYSQFLVVPIVLVVAMSFGALAATPSAPALVIWLSVAIGGLGLVSFSANYFKPFLTTGGASHRTFRTAAIDPKVQAARLIIGEAPAAGLTVVAEDWWIALPMRYLLAPYQVNVVQFDAAPLADRTLAEVLSNGGYIVAFSASDLDRDLERVLRPQQTRQWHIVDYAGARVLTMRRLARPQETHPPE